jgi:hypothetical protein
VETHLSCMIHFAPQGHPVAHCHCVCHAECAGAATTGLGPWNRSASRKHQMYEILHRTGSELSRLALQRKLKSAASLILHRQQVLRASGPVSACQTPRRQQAGCNQPVSCAHVHKSNYLATHINALQTSRVSRMIMACVCSSGGLLQASASVKSAVHGLPLMEA